MKKNLSILIYSLAGGGAERVVSILLYELQKEFNITLFLMNDTIFYEIPHDVKVVYLKKSNPTEGGIKKLLKLLFLAWEYKQSNKSDISLSFMNRPNYVNIIAKIFGMRSRIIVSERTAPSQEYSTNGIKDQVSKYLIRYLYPKADVIIANARGMEMDLIDNFGIKQNMKVINNPLDVDKILKKQKEPIDIELKKFSFITVGRFFKQKNHKLLIEAMDIMDANLYIIGDGELREEIETQIRELNLQDRVFLLGRKINPYKYLSKADCFVFSSDYEGFPNVLLEALVCGLPIISTDCQSGPREILAPDTDVGFKLKEGIEIAKYGILTPVEDKAHLQKAMHLIISNKRLRASYREKAWSRAKSFDKQIIVNEFIDILKKG